MPMPKLSTLIMRGVKKDGPKINGQLFRLNKDLEISGCCALGAALLGGFGVDVDKARRKAIAAVESNGGPRRGLKGRVEHQLNHGIGRLVRRLPGARRIVEFLPITSWIVSKNDSQRWSRERIAAELKKLGL